MRYLPVALLLILLAAPFLFEQKGEPADPDAPQLVIVTPHNEQIRWEFKRAFERWHEAKFGERVQVMWSTPGGTSEIRKLLISEYTAALEAGLPPGGNADLLWGGGTYEFTQLAKPLDVTVGEESPVSVLSTIEDVTPEWLESIYGDGMIADQRLFDPGHKWFGTALSSFGIVFNRDALANLGVPTPGTWQDLAVPKYDGWITMVDPGMSGSVTTAFEAILQRRGWHDGWRIRDDGGGNCCCCRGRSSAGRACSDDRHARIGSDAAQFCRPRRRAGGNFEPY